MAQTTNFGGPEAPRLFAVRRSRSGGRRARAGAQEGAFGGQTDGGSGWPEAGRDGQMGGREGREGRGSPRPRRRSRSREGRASRGACRVRPVYRGRERGLRGFRGRKVRLGGDGGEGARDVRGAARAPAASRHHERSGSSPAGSAPGSAPTAADMPRPPRPAPAGLSLRAAAQGCRRRAGQALAPTPLLGIDLRNRRKTRKQKTDQGTLAPVTSEGLCASAVEGLAGVVFGCLGQGGCAGLPHRRPRHQGSRAQTGAGGP